MIDVTTISTQQAERIYKSRFLDFETLHEKIVKDYEVRKNIWSGNPSWKNRFFARRSSATDNRTFLAVESQINKLTARPFKSTVSPGQDTDDSKIITRSLERILLKLYKENGVKSIMRRGLRTLHFAKLMCVKVYWDKERDDPGVSFVSPNNIYLPKYANCEKEADVIIERINNKRISEVIDMFDYSDADTSIQKGGIKNFILKKKGIASMQELQEKDDFCEYDEMWTNSGVLYFMDGSLIGKEKNPYWDYDGVPLNSDEMARIISKGADTRISGKRRRSVLSQPIEFSSRKDEEDFDEKYESYLYNHFDSKRKPYIFTTAFSVEDGPYGETTLIDIVAPLQEGIDKRKRQISDNADDVNGITKVDTDIVTMDHADAEKLSYQEKSVIIGPGVSSGVIRETGSPLPSFVYEDMEHSIRELDNIFGTGQTFRGENDRAETATGRAILQQEAHSRLDEYISAVDYVAEELYNWWYHLIRIFYTTEHSVKILGASKSDEFVTLMRDDLDDGIEVSIKPGSTLPDDKIFKAERAREDFQSGAIDIVTYLEQAGGYDNPLEIAKRATLFKINPLSILSVNEKDLQGVLEANQILQQINPQIQQQAEQQQETGNPIMDRVNQIVGSPEFQQLPPEEQAATIQQIRQTLTQGQ